MGIVLSQLVALTTTCRLAPWVAVKDKPVKFTFWRIHEPRRNGGINSLQVVAHAEGLPLMERCCVERLGQRSEVEVFNRWPQ